MVLSKTSLVNTSFYYFYLHEYVCVCMWVCHVSLGACEGRKTEFDLLELELHTVVNIQRGC